MSEPKPIKNVLIETLEKTPNNLSGKILGLEIFHHWKEIFGVLANQVLPLQIHEKILILYADNPAVKEQIKFLSNGLVDKINEIVGNGEKVIEKISFGQVFEKPRKDIDDFINPKFEKKSEKKFSDQELKKINLTDEEIAECEKKLDGMENNEQRDELLKTFLNRAKLRKLKIKKGWHKCKTCDVLCEPEEIFCGYCAIKNRGEMRKKIRRIFYDLPWTSFPNVQKKLLKEMPYMKNECNLTLIKSVWSELVRETAARISYDDKNSLDVKFLVMLYRQVDEKSLTENLIETSLKKLKYNLANTPTKF